VEKKEYPCTLSNGDAIAKGALRKEMRNMGKLCSKPQIISDQSVTK
jgi:hypothetical protein